MAKKKSTKRKVGCSVPAPIASAQRVLDDVRKLKKINRAIVAEGKAVGRLLERGNVVLGRVLADYLERSGQIAIDGAQYARLVDRVAELQDHNTKLVQDLEAADRQLTQVGQ